MNHDGKTNRAASPHIGGEALPIRPARGQGSESSERHQTRSHGWAKPEAEDRASDYRRSQFRPQFGQDPAGRLMKQIVDLLPVAKLRLILCDSTSWASATFSGARHLILLERGVEGPFSIAGQRVIASLNDHEFLLSRHLVADLTVEVLVDEDQHRLRIEALTVEVG